MVKPESTRHVVDFLSSADGLQLNRAFVLIKDTKLRGKIIGFLRALADKEEFAA